MRVRDLAPRLDATHLLLFDCCDPESPNGSMGVDPGPPQSLMGGTGRGGVHGNSRSRPT